MKVLKISDAEKDWQIDHDVQVLEDYQAIIADKERLEKAIKRSKEKMEEFKDRIDCLEKVQGMKK